MAVECGCEDLYRFEYHVERRHAQHVAARRRVQPEALSNPLHLGGHRVPSTATPPEDLYLTHTAPDTWMTPSRRSTSSEA
jgi:hypothetical protein